jgi:hypothetical protein
MILVTIQSCIGMMCETPTTRLVATWQLKVVEYLFIFFMSLEMALKVCAYGFLFTPNAVVKDFGGVLDLFIFSVSVVFIYLSPGEVAVNSPAHMLILLRCLRPLRIFTLVPHMRKVIRTAFFFLLFFGSDGFFYSMFFFEAHTYIGKRKKTLFTFHFRLRQAKVKGESEKVILSLFRK